MAGWGLLFPAGTLVEQFSRVKLERRGETQNETKKSKEIENILGIFLMILMMK